MESIKKRICALPKHGVTVDFYICFPVRHQRFLFIIYVGFFLKTIKANEPFKRPAFIGRGHPYLFAQ